MTKAEQKARIVDLLVANILSDIVHGDCDDVTKVHVQRLFAELGDEPSSDPVEVIADEVFGVIKQPNSIGNVPHDTNPKAYSFKVGGE